MRTLLIESSYREEICRDRIELAGHLWQIWIHGTIKLSLCRLMSTITLRCVLSHTQESPKMPWPQADHQLLMSICCWWWQCDTWHDWAKGSLVSWGKALLHRTSGAQARMYRGALSCVHPSTLSQGTVRPSTLTGLDSSQNALSYPKTCAPCTGSQRDFTCNFCTIWWPFLWQNWIFWKLWFLRNRVISEHAKGI